MKKSFYSFLIAVILLFPYSLLAQYEVEEFKPLPKGIEKITGLQYTIYEGDTTSENFSEFIFDKKGNTISWQYFPYYVKEVRKYDSLDRIIEIDGLYGESFANGITNYEYPSKNQKIEFHDKMGFFQDIKSDVMFDNNNNIVQEIRHSTTFDKIDNYGSTAKINISYSYDKYGNLVEELQYSDSTKELIYEMHALYIEDRLLNKTKKISEQSPNYSSADTETEEFFYIEEGEFKDKIEKETRLSMIGDYTSKNQIIYSYQKLDSIIFIEERKYFVDEQLNQHHKYFYKNNQLIKLEEYTIPKGNEKSKLSSWTDYTYFFYPKSKE